MIKLVGIFPRHLNLNGDFGNLEVLKKRIQWLGYDCEIIEVQLGQNLPDEADLIFIGHGSMAAWAEADKHLNQISEQIQKAIDNGSHLLAIGSGYEKMIALGYFSGSLNQVSRISKFEIAETDLGPVLGYLNTVSDAPIYQEKNRIIGSQLHGPLLAKNPDLADRIIGQIASKKVIVASRPKDEESLVRVRNLVDAVWALEEELARQ